MEFNSDNSAIILLEGDKPLGAEAHRYYDEIVRRVEQDKKHVQHVQDFWSDPLTAAGSQSHDQKAAYVQVYLAGNMGGGLANESALAVRKIVDSVPAPPGIKAYVTGAGPLFADQSHAGEKGLAVVTLITFVVIIVMLLVIYRSIITVAIMLGMVFIELAAARGVVATLGNYGVVGLSTFANNMLVLMAIAAGTDYAIFVVGRYHEARGLGETARAGVLHHVPQHRACGARIRPDHRRRDVLPELLPAAVLPVAGGAVCGRHAGRGAGGVDAGSGDADGRLILQADGSQAHAADPGLAPHGHRGRPLARAGSRCARSRSHWSVCSPCPVTRRTTTTATSCWRTPRPTSVMPPRTGTSTRRGSTPSC